MKIKVDFQTLNFEFPMQVFKFNLQKNSTVQFFSIYIFNEA